jgi:hypothetical protein
MAISKIGANGLSIGPATTISPTQAQQGINVSPDQLGFSIYDSANFTANQGFISVDSKGLANTLNLKAAITVSPTAAQNGANVPGHTLGTSIYNNRYFTTANGFVSITDEVVTQNTLNIATTLSRTTTQNGNTVTRSNLGVGVFDDKFFTANKGFISLKDDGTMTINVAAPTNANSAARFTDLVSLPADLLITALGSLDIQMTVGNAYSGSVDQAGSPSYISSASNMTLVGNASSLGTNYSVINSSYNLSGGNSYWGHVTFIIDMSVACGLSGVKFQADGVTINPKWKGNYDFSAFSALFKLNEINFWDYGGRQQTFAYQINLIPVTTDYNSASYGQYSATADVYAAQPYHNANLGARWMGLATKKRNLFAFTPI